MGYMQKRVRSILARQATHLLHYIAMFGLQIYAVGTENDAPIANDVYYLQGKRLVAGAAKSPEWPYQLSPDERKLGVGGLGKKYVAPLYKQIGHPDDAGWPNAAARDLDAITINQYLRGKGASDAVIKLLGLTFLGEDFNSVSALADVNWSKSRFWKEQGLSGTAYTDLPMHSVFARTCGPTRAIEDSEELPH